MRPDCRTLTVLLLVPLLAVLAACSSPEDKVAGHLKKAEDFMAAEDFKKAAIEAKNAVQIQPKNAQAHFILAKLAWRESKFQEVFSQLQMAVESDPTLIEARLRLGDLYFSSGDVEQAAAQAEAARQLDPDRADVHLLSGKVLYLKGDLPGAAAEIDAALAINPAYVDAYTAKAGLKGAQGDTAGALAVIDEGLTKTTGNDADVLRDFRLGLVLGSGDDQAYEDGLRALIAQFPDRPRYRYQLLDFYGSRARLDDEERLLRELVETDPGSHWVKVRLANRLLRKNDLAGAEQLLKDSVARYPDSAQLRLALGDFFRATKRPAEAMATYREAAGQWRENTPEGLEARNRIVAQHAADGDIAQARADIDAILKAAPDNPEALLTRATFAFLDRRYDAAIADLRTVLRREQSTEAALLLARSYVGAGDLVVAKDTYRSLLDRDPGNAAAAKELAVLLSGEGDAAAAAEILRAFVAVRPDDAEASAALVQNLLAQRDLEAAEAEAKRGIEAGKGNPLAEQQLGSVLQARGSSAEALARYRAALEKDPQQLQALEGLTGILLDSGRGAEAIDILKAYPPDDLNASLLLGRAYNRQGNVAAARAVHEQAIRLAPGDARAYLALAALSPTDSAEQMATLQRASKALPDNPTIAVFLGSLYQRKGRVDDAIAVYEAVLAKNAGDNLVLNNLVSLLLDRSKDKAGLARALELARPLAGASDPLMLDTLGWAYYRNDDFAGAVRTLERAVAADGSIPVLQYHLGKAYAAAGNAVSARQHLRLALEKGGDGAEFADDARVTLGRLGS
ncbi:MAG: tetratricopeptide repeat protein [Chromatiales bacterium]|nr:tetratricopeptide repeat protein [Chromatiales bacterium]